MNKFVRILIGLLGLSFVIVIHEFGHFLACKLFGIATPVFSIGFGPRLFGYQIGSTIFQIAAFPFGGYVAIATDQLDAQPYIIKAIILLAGIAINFLFAYLIFSFFRFRNINVRKMMQQTAEHTSKGVIVFL
jgi:regulator of sigma E protease